MNRIVLKSAALAGFLVVLCLGAAAIADPLKIRIGMQTPPDKFLTMLAHRLSLPLLGFEIHISLKRRTALLPPGRRTVHALSRYV